MKFVKLLLAIVLTIVTFVSAPIHTFAANPVLADMGNTPLERRTEAAARGAEGTLQEAFGKAADSPANQAEGKAKRISGASENRVEDLRDKARDAGQTLQAQGESLVDRVKDFFDAD